MPLTIAITGANGLVGQGVTRAALKEGHSVVALDIPAQGAEAFANEQGFRYHQLDATDYDRYYQLVKEGGCTAIVHLAATFNKFNDKGEWLSNVPSHDIYNKNSAMSWNTLEIATQLGIDRVVLASSVNAIGMVYSERPRFDYLPVDEKHPFYPETAYCVSKYVCEIQSDAFCRRFPSLRVASLRFHAVTPDDQCSPETLHQRKGSWKDLWGWVSLTATSNACLSGLTAPTSTFPNGHEAFFIVAPTTMQSTPSQELLISRFPELEGKMELEGKGNVGFISTAKAEKMLGWKEVLDNRAT